MSVYVAEIAGRGVVAFDAANEDGAKARLADKAFQRDLYVLQNSGRPLWDGVADIRLRGASPKEAETWQAGHAGDEAARVFLIHVVDPSGYDDDDDDDDHHDHGD
jgi:hypothetical protein